MVKKPTYEELERNILGLERAGLKYKQKVKKLENDLERWESLAKNTPSFLTIVNKDHVVEYINHPVTGFDHRNVVGQKVYKFIQPDYHDTVREMIESVFSNGQPLCFESVAKGPEKTLANYNNHLGPIIIENKITAVSIIGIDTTHRKQVEDDLIKKQYFLQKSQEIGNIGTWELDLKRNELFWTDENYRIFGLPIGTQLTYEIFLDCVHPDDRDFVDRKWIEALKGNPYDIEHRLLVNGKTKWVREKAELEFDKKGVCVRSTGFTQDITYHKRAGEHIRASLKEKETLLQELYHRTKNNMQVIMSMIDLKSLVVQDDTIVQILKELSNRIKSMALVHEKLYQSKNLSNIDLNEYIEDLIARLIMSYKDEAKKTSIIMSLDNVSVSIDSAIPIGLIINELVTNSLKYAFPEGKTGEISISLRYGKSENIEILIGDDGIGLPRGFDFEETGTFGIQIVKDLAEQQLCGKFNLNTSRGTEYKIAFKNPISKVKG